MPTTQWLATALLAIAMSAHAQDGTFQTRSLTPEAALTATRAAFDACRKHGKACCAIGVSGGPGGEADDGCAAAGIKAIADAIEF